MIPAKMAHVTREEILSELQRLDVRERGLKEQWRDTAYRLEQIVSERRRLERHLAASFASEEETAC